jgi:hypothetical protein
MTQHLDLAGGKHHLEASTSGGPICPHTQYPVSPLQYKSKGSRHNQVVDFVVSVRNQRYLTELHLRSPVWRF